MTVAQAVELCAWVVIPRVVGRYRGVGPQEVMAVSDLIARQAALAALEAAERRFLQRHETAKALGNHADAEGARKYAQWCHSAYEAEAKNPAPRDPK